MSTDFMGAVRELNLAYTENTGAHRYVYTETYGCQQNESDSELYRGIAREMGYFPAENAESADLIVINTCAVREHAEMRILGNVGALSHIKKRKPELIIILAGCMMSEPHMREKIKKSFPYVSGFIDAETTDKFAEVVHSILETGKRRYMFGGDGEVLQRIEGLPREREDSIKAWLPIMKGCDNFCSYCIVPYVRGRERSRPAEEVIGEAGRILKSGYKEITLLGQNVNSYAGGIPFAALLREIGAMDGEFRLRFMTSHPKDASAELFRAMAESKNVCRSLHLPFQSGSDRILAMMNRGYTAEAYRRKIADARALMPGLTVTSDVIVGFPGETEDDFQKTLELVREIGFASLFTFIYSRREGTKAAELEDIATKDEIKDRFARLLALQDGIAGKNNAGLIGERRRVLIDGRAKDGNRLSARTDGGQLVVLDGDEGMIGAFADAEIVGASPWSFTGRIC